MFTDLSLFYLEDAPINTTQGGLDFTGARFSNLKSVSTLGLVIPKPWICRNFRICHIMANPKVTTYSQLVNWAPGKCGSARSLTCDMYSPNTCCNWPSDSLARLRLQETPCCFHHYDASKSLMEVVKVKNNLHLACLFCIFIEQRNLHSTRIVLWWPRCSCKWKWWGLINWVKVYAIWEVWVWCNISC